MDSVTPSESEKRGTSPELETAQEQLDVQEGSLVAWRQALFSTDRAACERIDDELRTRQEARLAEGEPEGSAAGKCSNPDVMDVARRTAWTEERAEAYRGHLRDKHPAVFAQVDAKRAKKINA